MTSAPDYPTLAKLIQKLRPLVSSTLKRIVVNPMTGASSEETIPAFLFRGESRVYPSICSSRHRFEQDTRFSKHEKSIINYIGGKLDELLQQMGLHSMGSAALLQHYRFPTEVIDTTSSIDIAASFAISGGISNKPGRILLYPMDSLMENAIVIDLSIIYWSRRPLHQRGFMIFHADYQDWQHERLIDDVHVEEHRFIGSEEDRQCYDKTANLIGLPTRDPVSGLLNKLVHDIVLSDKPPLPKKVADWLDDRIPWAEFPCRVVSKGPKGRPKEIEPDFSQFATFNADL